MSALEVLLALSSKRRKWVEAEELNHFNTRQILVELYPDQAHFVFELLQNAEDAKAWWVAFHLERDRLLVRHNGRRQFTEEDVDGITSIAKQAKRDDVTQIGKFGIGFKAVFGYTSAPEVRSADYHFRIEDLVVPVPIEPIKLGHGITQFELPFNLPDKPGEACFREIRETLDALDDSAILFLRNIEEIRWQIGDGPETSVTRIPVADHLVAIDRSAGASVTKANYLRFTKEVSITKGVGEGLSFVAVAYLLRNKSDGFISRKIPLADQVEVVPDSGRLCVFFPAEKETTKLRFHVHGPFASTVGRDSIPHDLGNRRLLAEVADLAAQSLSDVKEMGLLAPPFLDVLPNARDDLDEFFAPIREAIVDRMRDHPLVPNRDGGHSPAAQLVQSLDSFKQLFTHDDLAVILDRHPLQWAVNVNQRNSPRDQFLTDLGVPRWEADHFISFLSKHFTGVETTGGSKARSWLLAKDAAWLRSLYVLIAAQFGRLDYRRRQVRDWAIVRTESGRLLRGGNVFMPVEGSPVRGVETLANEILRSANQNDQESLKEFLEIAGVESVGERQYLAAILEENYTDRGEGTIEVPEADLHLEHIKRFVAWHQAGEDCEFFVSYWFLLDPSRDQVFQPDQVYVDQPFRETGLRHVVATGLADYDLAPLWPGYQEVPNFLDFLEDLGALTRLKPLETYVYGHPNEADLKRDQRFGARTSHLEVDRDFTIPGLEALLKRRDVDVARVVWTSMNSMEDVVLRAAYRPNGQHRLRTAPSRLVLTLRGSPWVPTRSGTFLKPAETTEEDLPPGFDLDANSDWLKEVGFGEVADRANAEYRQVTELAEQFGLVPEAFEVLRRLPRDRQRAFLATLDSFVAEAVRADDSSEGEDGEDQQGRGLNGYVEELRHAFDRAGSTPGAVEPLSELGADGKVSDRRREAVEADIRDAISRAESGDQTFRRVPMKRWNAKDYVSRRQLLEAYEGKCQICGDVFAKRDGKPYFEGVYLVSRTKGEWLDRWGNILSLCARHSAMFQHGPVVADDIEGQILAIDVNGGHSPQVRVTLCGQETTIVFRRKHMLDLQTLLRISRET